MRMDKLISIQMFPYGSKERGMAYQEEANRSQLASTHHMKDSPVNTCSYSLYSYFNNVILIGDKSTELM